MKKANWELGDFIVNANITELRIFPHWIAEYPMVWSIGICSESTKDMQWIVNPMPFIYNYWHITNVETPPKRATKIIRPDIISDEHMPEPNFPALVQATGNT